MTRQVRAREDGGFSLTELLVVIMLLGVVSAMVMSLVIQSTKIAGRQENQTATLDSAKTAMERVTRAIRGANSLVTTTSRELSLVTRTSGVREQTTFLVRTTASGTELVQHTTTSNLTTGAVISDGEKLVLGGLAVGRSEAIFSYYAGDYYGEGDARTVLLSPATPGNARTVGVRVRLNREHGAPPLDLYQVVSIRNLED